MSGLSFGSMAVGMLALAAGVLLARRQGSDTRFAIGLVVVAFVLRAACALVIHVAQLPRDGTGALFQDDYTNDLIAGWLLRVARGEPISVFLGHEHLLADSYVYVLAALYFVVGHDPLAAKLISAGLGGVLALVAYDLAFQIAGRGPARLTGLLVAVFPSLVLWTSLAVKEGLVLVLSVVLLRSLALAANGVRPLHAGGLAWLAVGAVVLGSLRLPAIGVVIALVPLVVAARSATDNTLSRRLRIGLLAATVAGVVGIGAVMLSPTGVSLFGAKELESLPAKIQLKRVLIGERGRTSLLATDERDRELAEANPANVWDVLGYMPEGLRYALLSPTPWSARSGSEILLAMETVAWYGLLVFAAVGAVRLWGKRRPELVCVVVFLGLHLVILALFDTNLGTLVRHRTVLYPATVFLASVGLLSLHAAGPSLMRSRRRLEVAVLGAGRRGVADC